MSELLNRAREIKERLSASSIALRKDRPTSAGAAAEAVSLIHELLFELKASQLAADAVHEEMTVGSLVRNMRAAGATGPLVIFNDDERTYIMQISKFLEAEPGYCWQTKPA